MPNVNCLAGIACPACGHDESFLITALIRVRLTDNGIDDGYAFKHGDGYETDDATPMRCEACDHTAPATTFRQPDTDDDDLGEFCRQCAEPSDDGEGYDGFCGNCADLVQGHLDGDHAVPRPGCPCCDGMDVSWV